MSLHDFMADWPKEKLCTKCGEVKPLSDFHKLASTSTSFRSHFGSECKLCNKMRRILGPMKASHA